MAIAEAPVGTSTILRLSGCPISVWLAAANPHLFSLVRHLESVEADYRLKAQRLAEWIGLEIVPCEALSRTHRALALELRRQLHKGEPVDESVSERMIKEIGYRGIGTEPFVQLFRDIVKRGSEYTDLKERLEQTLLQEETRVARVAWEHVSRTPVLEILLRDFNPEFYTEMQTRAKRMNFWTSNSAKRSSRYLWKIIDRAATKQTPRGWHAHVALMQNVPSWQPASDMIDVTDEVATTWCENIHAQRQELAKRSLTTARPDLRIGISALYWQEDDRVTFWIVDPENPLRMMEVQMRLTSLLDPILKSLAGGAKTLDEYRTQLTPVLAEAERELLEPFTEYLIGQHVLQVSASPRSMLQMWQLLGSEDTEHTLPSSLQNDGFLDVYRRTNARLPLPSCVQLQRLFEQTQRLLAMISADGSDNLNSVANTASEDAEPLLSVLRQQVLATVTPVSMERTVQRELHWRPAKHPDSPYAQLLSWIMDKADEPGDIDISSAVLDDLAAPGGSIDWPIDCVVRVPRGGAAYAAVLDEAFPAGSLDARFIGAMQTLYSAVPQYDSYYEFLEILEQNTGIEFVELLIPPLSLGAANAVRRPLYTRAWTGDADQCTYFSNECCTPRFVPLSAINIRQAGSRRVAEVNGRQIFPVYHATRMPLAPWNMIAAYLMAAAPFPMRWSPRRLHYSLDAFPDRTFIPRITIGGQLVLSGAQWRLPSRHLWDPDLSLHRKVQMLERLRYQWHFPRWVFVSPEFMGKPLACDLESIRAIQIFESIAKVSDTNILVVEMLPTPDEFMTSYLPHDGTNQYVASSLALRFPCDESPQAMARRLAPMIV